MKICPHCFEDTAIRNPSGFCDHLYYPDCCDVCKGKVKKQILVSREALERMQKYVIEGKTQMVLGMLSVILIHGKTVDSVNS